MTALRLLLNSGFSGANAFFALAQQRGLFRSAGIDVELVAGRGAYTAAGRLADEGFDAAYGDLNALIELAALRPADALPIAVFMVHQHAPSCITVARDGPVQHPGDLAGRAICGHASDVALRTFPAYARAAGLDARAVQIEVATAGMAELLRGMLHGGTDAVFGYVTTHTAALAETGLRVDTLLRFLPYREVCADLYGSALMVAPQLLRESPGTVAALVRATRGAITATWAQPEAAIDALMALNPAATAHIEIQRLLATLYDDMGAPSGMAGPWQGLGAASYQRLGAAIASLAAASGWEHPPNAERVFTRRFL